MVCWKRQGGAPRQTGRLLRAVPLVAALVLAGCLEGGDDGADDAFAPAPPDAAAQGNETVPAPVILRGSAIVANPAHVAFCAGSGIDGGFHEIGRVVDGWHYRTAPADTFAVYWWGEDGYLEGGEGRGKVPDGSTHAEVCNKSGIGPVDYALTLVHGDKPDT